MAEVPKIPRHQPKVVFWCSQNLTSCFGHCLSKAPEQEPLPPDIGGITHMPEASHMISTSLNRDQGGSRQIKQSEQSTSAVTGLNHGRYLRGCTACSSLCRYISLSFHRAYLAYTYPEVCLLGAAPACSFIVNYIARNTAAPTATLLLHYNNFLKMTLGPRYLSGKK